MLLAKSKNLTPQPPSLRGKGGPESPSPLRGGVGEGSDLEMTLPTASLISGRTMRLVQNISIRPNILGVLSDRLPTNC
ncbi:MAG TPA: hypothetical protein DCY88_32480 [Cyanobacteria bacterium UBA11372]|nr:hypothetical protein [Cyanobacteria bacterium UBA11372]